MRQRIQRMLTAAVGLLLLLSASGCGFSFSPTDLYSLPQLPEEYTELNSSLNQLLESGAEYAAPVSGSNIQPVQLEDLDGDGEEEALAFFRNSADEKPLKIYIFTAGKQGYEQAAVIEGTGTSIYSIAYEDLDQDGRKELLVGWRVNTDPPGPLRLHPAVRGAGGAGAGHQLCEICGQRSESGWPVGAGGAPGR